MKTTIYTSRAFLKHETGHNHPECPARLATLLDLFEQDFADVPQKEVQPAEIDDIARVHPESYIYDLMDKVPDIGFAPIDAEHECVLSPASWEVLIMAVGAGLNALDDIMSGQTERAFCAVRPPGHHAERAKPMGFCFFNNAFIAARYAQEKHNINKIAIIDFDVHHGNGTDALTRAHNQAHPAKPIFYASSQQYPLWPMSGLPEDNTAHILNILLPEAAKGVDMMRAYDDRLIEPLKAYAPELLILSAGFDAHKDDPLAGLSLESEDFGALTEMLIAATVPTTKGRILSLLEGGYDLKALKSSVSAHLKALLK